MARLRKRERERRAKISASLQKYWKKVHKGKVRRPHYKPPPIEKKAPPKKVPPKKVPKKVAYRKPVKLKPSEVLFIARSKAAKKGWRTRRKVAKLIEEVAKAPPIKEVPPVSLKEIEREIRRERRELSEREERVADYREQLREMLEDPALTEEIGRPLKYTLGEMSVEADGSIVFYLTIPIASGEVNTIANIFDDKRLPRDMELAVREREQFFVRPEMVYDVDPEAISDLDLPDSVTRYMEEIAGQFGGASHSFRVARGGVSINFGIRKAYQIINNVLKEAQLPFEPVAIRLFFKFGERPLTKRQRIDIAERKRVREREAAGRKIAAKLHIEMLEKQLREKAKK